MYKWSFLTSEHLSETFTYLPVSGCCQFAIQQIHKLTVIASSAHIHRVWSWFPKKLWFEIKSDIYIYICMYNSLAITCHSISGTSILHYLHTCTCIWSTHPWHGYVWLSSTFWVGLVPYVLDTECVCVCVCQWASLRRWCTWMWVGCWGACVANGPCPTVLSLWSVLLSEQHNYVSCHHLEFPCWFNNLLAATTIACTAWYCQPASISGMPRELVASNLTHMCTFKLNCVTWSPYCRWREEGESRVW